MSHILKIQTLIQMIFKVMYKAKYVILKHEHILKSKEFFFSYILLVRIHIPHRLPVAISICCVTKYPKSQWSKQVSFGLQFCGSVSQEGISEAACLRSTWLKLGHLDLEEHFQDGGISYLFGTCVLFGFFVWISMESTSTAIGVAWTITGQSDIFHGVGFSMY